MKMTFSKVLAVWLVIILCLSCSPLAMAYNDKPTDYFSTHYKFSTAFMPSITVGMQLLENFTMSDWLKDDNRELLAVCLFGDAITAEETWEDYFQIDDISTGGYIAKTGTTEIAYCLWTTERTMCITYNPYKGTGTYAMYPFSREEIVEMFGDAPYWLIDDNALTAAVIYVGMVLSAANSGN